jgi:hypothetical protein
MTSKSHSIVVPCRKMIVKNGKIQEVLIYPSTSKSDSKSNKSNKPIKPAHEITPEYDNEEMMNDILRWNGTPVPLFDKKTADDLIVNQNLDEGRKPQDSMIIRAGFHSANAAHHRYFEEELELFESRDWWGNREYD